MRAHRVLVFGSRNLTACHLSPLVVWLRTEADLVSPETKLQLIHGDGPPGKHPGAIGADKLSEVAAVLAWAGRERGVRRHPVVQQEGESRGVAEIRRDREMARTTKPFRAVCFHTDAGLGRGSAATANFLKREGVGFTLVLLSASGEVLSTEDR